MGNIYSVLNSFKFISSEAAVVNDSRKLNQYSAFILPGVGAFPYAIKNMNESKLSEELKNQILIKKKPILGICLGMQLLLQKSFENEETEGLNCVSGEVRAVKKKKDFPIPIVGWHRLKIINRNILFKGIQTNSFFYFDHSYYCSISNKKFISAEINYSSKICASYKKNNIFGVQFHPEKSQLNGLRLLKNFITIAKRF